MVKKNKKKTEKPNTSYCWTEQLPNTKPDKETGLLLEIFTKKAYNTMNDTHVKPGLHEAV